jgi:hypothetical protein
LEEPLSGLLGCSFQLASVNEPLHRTLKLLCREGYYSSVAACFDESRADDNPGLGLGRGGPILLLVRRRLLPGLFFSPDSSLHGSGRYTRHMEKENDKPEDSSW